jgi:MoaA/NifB/PqqE/SkfB family radical SAM enzyme
MKIQPYNNFWQRIHKSAKSKGFPLRVMFELTYRCNFYCKHCYVPQGYRKKGELKTKEVFSIMDQLADIGCFYLGFTGGEPFIREDMIDILWYAKKLGFEIIIYTNGSLINKERAAELVRLRPNKVDITIPAMTEDAFERISGLPGSRDRVFGAIDLLYKTGVNLGFKTCVLKENESEIKDIQDFAHSLVALHRLDDMLSARLDGSEEPYRYRGENRLSIIDHRLSKETECQTPKTEHLKPNTNNLFKCGVGVSQAAITPFGELKMCLMINYPKYRILGVGDRKTRIYANQTRMDANKYSCDLALDSRGFALKDAWERLKELVASIEPDENYRCDKCELEPYCKWCPAKAWLYNKTFTCCEPESRKWAEIRSQEIKAIV